MMRCGTAAGAGEPSSRAVNGARERFVRAALAHHEVRIALPACAEPGAHGMHEVRVGGGRGARLLARQAEHRMAHAAVLEAQLEGLRARVIDEPGRGRTLEPIGSM